mgnify:CR=1 FL=1
MNREEIEKRYEQWVACAAENDELADELQAMKDDPKKKEDAFFKDLSFGTGGLRGILGAGPNRMNVYTVARAARGVAAYVKANFAPSERRIAISYDSRIHSDLFARISAQVFAGAGIEAWIYPELMPTPCLSFAVRQLRCAAGVMVTASHNPAEYNGYKVYGPDGCQITEEAAAQILARIEAEEMFGAEELSSFEEGLAAGQIRLIGEDVYAEYVRRVSEQSVLTAEENIDKNVSIVYTPLNGTGLKPVLRTLKENGYGNITVVEEQREPDGSFPTCPYPNPEIREAMELGIRYAAREDAELVLATDPDCDRVGIAVKGPEGRHVLLSGNETGMLLLDYLCARRAEQRRLPENPVFIKTIVTTDMAQRIAARYGVGCINVLTGFKYIGEQIGRLEREGRAEDFVFGFEESYGYLSGSYVRDKDGVVASLLICEMFAWYKSRGVALYDRLMELYKEYGFCLNTLHSYSFPGAAGFVRMQEIMKSLRESSEIFAGIQITERKDYRDGIDGLPPSDVLRFALEGGGSVVIRPSGTEPKIKAYICVSALDQAAAKAAEAELAEELARRMEQ